MTFPANDSIATYGGLFADAAPVVDPTTDMSAAQGNAMSASVAAMTATCPVAWVRFVTDATTPTLAIGNSNNAAWGNASGVRPVVTRLGLGIFQLVWPTTIVDGTGATQSVSFKRATVNVEGVTAYLAQPLVTAANTVRVYTFTVAGSANDIAGATVLVTVGG